MRIDREGNWFYQGGKIERTALVKLFSSILKKEENDYFLITPVEKWRIQVDIAPFAIISCRKLDGKLLLTTNIDNEIVVDETHPITVTEDESGQPVPKVRVQRGWKL